MKIRPLRVATALPVGWVGWIPLRHLGLGDGNARTAEPAGEHAGVHRLEARVPPDHPLRTIKRFADRALAELSPLFDAMYAADGRPSIPPERLLKACLLISLYSVRSERAFCEALDYDLLFRWFLDMNADRTQL